MYNLIVYWNLRLIIEECKRRPPQRLAVGADAAAAAGGCLTRCARDAKYFTFRRCAAETERNFCVSPEAMVKLQHRPPA